MTKSESNSAKNDRSRLCDITLDEHTLVHTNADIEHERKVAIFDLLEGNYFAPADVAQGPYCLHLSILDSRLVFGISDEHGGALGQVLLSLSPFRRIVKDYFLMCESYFEAIKTASPSHIEAIDMGRRGLHNEGSEILRERLDGKIDLDFDTSRRLFTLLCVLHIKG